VTHQKLYNFLTAIIYSFGAGVYEEIVFRLVLLSFMIYVLTKLIHSNKGNDNFLAVFLSLFISGVLFAAAHGITNVAQFSLEPMVFRTVSGIIFGAVFILRGLAVAVFMHTIYDLLVFLIY
jgi:membrane protease YdiL (CAAX protease family)